MNIEQYLKKHGLTQAEFSRMLAKKRVMLSAGAVSHFITGRTRPSPQRAIQIEKATNGQIQRRRLRPDLWGGK